MNKFMSNMTRSVGQAMTKVKNAKGTPKVLLITGVATIVASGIYACVQTLKVEEKIDEAKESIDHVKELKEDGEFVVNTETGETAEYTPALYRKDMFYAWSSGIWSIAKLYIPSVIGTTIGVTMIGSSHKIMADRLTQTTLALTAMSEAYEKYRRNVIREYGEEVDERMRLGLETKKNLEMKVIDPETGEITTVKEKKLDVVADVGNIASPYAIILNDCGFWTNRDKEDCYAGVYNESCINARLNILQAKLSARHYISLYQILEEFNALDIVSDKTISMALQTGIVEGFGDGDLRVKVIPTRLGSEDCYRPVLLMDFNCIGGDYVDGEYVPFVDIVGKQLWKSKGIE